MKGPLALGSHAPSQNGTGVATYSSLLTRGVAYIGAKPLVIEAGAPRGKWVRRLRALQPGIRHAGRTEEAIVARDVFREAQVHFDLYGKPLQLVCPGSSGIAHWTYPVPVYLRGWKNVYTVHDAIPLTCPELTPIDSRRHARLLTALASRATHFVTVSEAAREEIISALGCPADFVTDLGEPIDVGGVDLAETIPNGFVQGSYFLHCGTIEPRKNILALVEAHAQSWTHLPLVLAGPAGWRAEEIGAILDRRPNIVRLGYVDRTAMLRLIAGARALMMPSLAEGFGLPVAEAMALGTPVLTSGSGALAETAGGAALTVDVHDTGAMAEAIARLTTDDGLCARLRDQGRARAAAFRLDAFAERLGAFYDALETA